jgi:glycosyltransferase involved in cell wall biosynthesis
VPKPRVTHLVESLEIGGAEKLVCDFVSSRGADTTSVICLELVGALGDALRAQGVRVDLAGMEPRWKTIPRLRRLLQRDRPDILHCHNFTAHFFGAMAARSLGGIPVLMTKHGAMSPSNKGTGLLNRWLARSTQVVAVSPEAVRVMKPWERPGRPILYIPNGISLHPYDEPVSREDARRRLGWPSDAFAVGIIARVTAIKGHVRLLDVFSRVLQRVPGAILVIAGDGPARGEVERRISELRLQSSVHFLGERHDIPLILSALNVFCLPSETEGMPITLLEAMAAARPVVVSRVGAIPDVVEDGVSGILVSPFDSAAIDRALWLLAEDPERAARMGEAGRRRVFQDYNAETALKNYEAVYERMLGN